MNRRHFLRSTLPAGIAATIASNSSAAMLLQSLTTVSSSIVGRTGSGVEIIVEAAKLGGEAVILGSESTDSEFVFTGTAMIQSDTRKLSGEVIVYGRG